MFSIRYEGLRELGQALRAVNFELFAALVAGLKAAGDIVRVDARARFVEYGTDGTEKRAASFVHAADGLQTLVRPNTSTMALLSVGQTIRRSRDMPRRRSNFGDLMMRHGLLPARTAELPAVAAAIDTEVTTLLRTHGF